MLGGGSDVGGKQQRESAEPESTADENKELSEDVRDLGPRQEGLVRIGESHNEHWGRRCIEMADVDANKQRYEPYEAGAL